MGKYPVPSNCKDLTITRVNTEVWRACLPATRDADLKLQQMQKHLVSSIIPLALLNNRILGLGGILGGETLNELVRLVICLTNKEINYKRRENIKPDLQAD